jgi:hypothetical protein
MIIDGGCAMKRIFFAFFMCAILSLTSPAFGDSASLPPIVEAVARNLDFFSQRWVLKGYEDCFLYSVKRIDRALIGVEILMPDGFDVQLVYGVKTLDVIYREDSIPEKSRREYMRLKSLSVTDVKKIVRGIERYQKNNPQK